VHGCVEILVNGCWAAATSFRCGHVSPDIIEVLPKLLVVAVAMRSRWRQNCYSFLHSWLEGRSQGRAAAAVASLVGGCGAEEVVRLAGSRFRAVQLDDLLQEDLADNVPDPKLYAKSSSCCLSECDAFISHSWHDSAPAKWAALQSWRQKFVAQHGREPKVWLDKCCIDQSNIQTDLRCLPVFLGGCHKLVVLCGPTYLGRLWCIVEVFTFVHMCRSPERLEFEVVVREECQEEDLSKVQSSLDSFDADLCACHVAEDKDRLLNIILVAFGSMSGFNSAVRTMLQEMKFEGLWMTPSHNSLINSHSSEKDASSGPGSLGAEDNV